jgi:phage terminase large subunit
MKLSGGINLEFLIDNFDFEKANRASRIDPLKWDEEDLTISDKQGFILEGGSGSAKTYDIIQFLLYYCEKNRNKGKDILIFRSTAADCKKTVLKDFIKILRMYGLYDMDKHFMSSPIHFDIFGNTIYFSGLDAIGAHGDRHDIIWGNEILECEPDGFKQLNQRCNECFIVDYNPSCTEHWVYNTLNGRPDTKFFHSTAPQNAFLPKGQRQEIMAYEPTPENIKNGTADDFMWKVYGLGLRGQITGLIFKNVEWIDSMPEGIELHTGLDFGFTNDPTCLVKFGLQGNDLFAQSFLYEPIDNSPALSDALTNLGLDRSQPITADCSDKYNDVEMVKELKNLGWNIRKVNKGKGINWRIGLIKKHKIYLVRDVNVKREQENYKWRQINGISVNEPVDAFNHFWDSLGYAYLGAMKITDYELYI